MADTLVSFDFRRFEGDLAKLGDGMAEGNPHLRQGLRNAAMEYLDFARRRFEANAAGGGGWAPLAESTVKSKGSAVPILEKSGALHLSLTPGAPGNVIQIVGLGVEVGTEDRKAALHHFGGGNLPARPVLPVIDDQTAARIDAKLSSAVDAACADLLRGAA